MRLIMIGQCVCSFVRGLEGNAGFLLPGIRDGILIHTGEWANYSAWREGEFSLAQFSAQLRSPSRGCCGVWC
jgi:hypothetical protein